MGDNISMLQLLPDALQCMPPNGSRSHCMIAFLDFAKAYDTVSRPFLKAVMTQMGVGVGFLNWTDLFLAPSPTRAMVNGFLSQTGSFRGGVRQGCPLSPSVYLFIGQALSWWLSSSRLGITFLDRRYVSCQVADDTKVI